MADGTEIERKYLLRALPEMPAHDVLEIEQGYIPGRVLVERLRRQQAPDGTVTLYRTVKVGRGIERTELEEETTPRVFEHMWVLTEGRRVRKRRHVVREGGRTWEIDEYLDRELSMAEVELETRDDEVRVPAWLARVLVREVTGEREYTNHSLAR